VQPPPGLAAVGAIVVQHRDHHARLDAVDVSAADHAVRPGLDAPVRHPPDLAADSLDIDAPHPLQIADDGVIGDRMQGLFHRA